MASQLKATDARQAGQDRPAGGRVRRGLPRVPRARGRARRPRRAPPRHRLEPRPRRGLDDHRQGLAAEGHRPRPRRRARACRTAAAAASPSAPSRASTPSRSTARRAVAPCARPSRCTPPATASRCSTPRPIDEPVDQAGRRGARQVGRAQRPTLVLCDAEEIGVAEELPQPARRRRAAGQRGRRRRRDRPRLAGRLPGALSSTVARAAGANERRSE